jgi:signal transduction histidine kinase
VLLNLITNAVESMADEDGPRILSVKCEVQDGGGVMVSIADTGAGIGAQDAARIFNPLFTTKSGGMGMGLSICRSIIEAHDGHLVVELLGAPYFNLSLDAASPASAAAS